MTIVYKTSDQVQLEELHRENAVKLRYTKHSSFIAPCFSLRNDERIEFAVYSAMSNKVHHVVVAFDEKEDILDVVAVRAFQVSQSEKDNVIAQLVRNKGVLDSEYRRLHAVTHNFTYSLEIDRQAQPFYAAEDALPHSIKVGLRYGNKRIIADEFNDRNKVKPTDPGYVLDYRSAVLFGEEVLADYGIEDIRLEGGVSLHTSAAACEVIGPMRRRMFDMSAKLRLGFNPRIPIMRGTILHEIAHAIDLREFGGFSHGPTFVLIFCELLAKYTNLGFVQCLDHFISKGIKVANPIYSELFHELPRERRRDYEKQHNEAMAR